MIPAQDNRWKVRQAGNMQAGRQGGRQVGLNDSVEVPNVKAT